MTKFHESNMLGNVRRWREKAYGAAKEKPLPERVEKAAQLARRHDLSLGQPHKTGGCP